VFNFGVTCKTPLLLKGNSAFSCAAPALLPYGKVFPARLRSQPNLSETIPCRG
jgi:hypothetical protein